MDDQFINQVRNEGVSRKELSLQSEALLTLRPLETLLGAHLRRGPDGCEVDVISAIMWLFDSMMYYESRAEMPGVTRLEAEHVLAIHFNEAYPRWTEDQCKSFGASLFEALVPKDAFSFSYFDFVAKGFKRKAFRYISWQMSPCGSKRIFNLTDYGIILYTTRLDGNAMDMADIESKHAERTLRRGEIDMAVDHILSTRTRMENFMTKIRVILRAVSTGNLQYAFDDNMKPLIEDACLTLKDIAKRINDSLHSIRETKEKGDLDAVKRDKFRKAEKSFLDVLNYTRRFRKDINQVLHDFIECRTRLVAKRDENLFSESIKDAVLVPLLKAPAKAAQGHLDDLVRNALPPHETQSAQDRHTLLDIERALTLLNEDFQVPMDEIPLDDERDFVLQREPEDYIPASVAKAIFEWIDEALKTRGTIGTEDVLKLYQDGELDYKEHVAAMMIVGGLVASDDTSLSVELGEHINSIDWRGRNISIHRPLSN